MILPPIAPAALLFSLIEPGFAFLPHHVVDQIPLRSLLFGYLPLFIAVVATPIILLVNWTVHTDSQKDSLSPKQKSHSGVSHET